jgi:rhamnosyltransferase
MKTRTAAIITAYRPDGRFGERFEEAASFCDRVFVVDNTPGGHEFGELSPKFVVIQDGRNKGLGPALNQGLDAARAIGIEVVFLFDQDSSPSRELLASLEAALSSSNDKKVCVGPLHLDDQVAHPAKPDSLDRTGLAEVTCLATSGMTFSLKELEPQDCFSSDLFLDFVDFEWCWRLRTRGWTFYRSSNARMPHRLGLSQRRFLGLTYHVPSPYRHYFQFRDTIKLVGWTYTPLYSRLRLVGILPLKILFYPFLLDRGGERVWWMAKGVADGVAGVVGVGAAKDILG